MARNNKIISHAHLGKVSNQPINTLERIPWDPKVPTTEIKLNCSEFSSHCPVTGQPDYGHLLITYSPKKYLVETKSLKLFLWSYRERKEFNEVLTDEIASIFMQQIEPWFVDVTGTFNARGGISVVTRCSRFNYNKE